MLSESARMTTAAEARYRISYPNSLRREVMVVALDKPSAALLNGLSKLSWNGARFFTVAPPSEHKSVGKDELKAWLNDLAGRALNLVDEVTHSDFVVVVTYAGEDARSVSMISEICQLHHKSLIALVVPRADASDETITASLKYLRPCARMLVVTHGLDYVEAMLTALRA